MQCHLKHEFQRTDAVVNIFSWSFITSNFATEDLRQNVLLAPGWAFIPTFALLEIAKYVKLQCENHLSRTNFRIQRITQSKIVNTVHSAIVNICAVRKDFILAHGWWSMLIHAGCPMPPCNTPYAVWEVLGRYHVLLPSIISDPGATEASVQSSLFQDFTSDPGLSWKLTSQWLPVPNTSSVDWWLSDKWFIRSFQ